MGGKGAKIGWVTGSVKVDPDLILWVLTLTESKGGCYGVAMRSNGLHRLLFTLLSVFRDHMIFFLTRHNHLRNSHVA